jgi:hypothetical protein
MPSDSSAPVGEGADNSSLSISPAVIIAIVILVAFFSTIIFASVYRFCHRHKDIPNLSSANFRQFDTGNGDFNPDEFWNPNRLKCTEQQARLKQVREINQMHAWQRGREARIEIGELRRPTMMVGRSGENRSWDEYTVADGSSGRGVSSHEIIESNAKCDRSPPATSLASILADRITTMRTRCTTSVLRSKG